MIIIPEHLPILVVDDDVAERAILKAVLEESNLRNEIIFIADGRAAIDYLESTLDGKNPIPGLALLDINMPGLSGFDVLSHLRARDEFRELPVVVMISSSDAKEDKTRAGELGANAFLPKQSGFADFVNLVNNEFGN